jgi:hypothetical protein
MAHFSHVCCRDGRKFLTTELLICLDSSSSGGITFPLSAQNPLQNLDMDVIRNPTILIRLVQLLI